MIKNLYIFESTGVDPYTNLAIEKYLLEFVDPESCILYLWQNQNTVVIGSNQNPWVECRTSLLAEEGGKLARRLSGGGAVFHDLGNLNFTFLVSADNYDVDRQLSVIQAACSMAGIRAEKSGRNDLLADERKFSGNAFYQSKGRAYHHGTILICADMEKMQRYLSPSKAKLKSKGVNSVRSRVVNLQQLAPQLSIATMKKYMCEAFSQVYGLPATFLELSELAWTQIESDRLKNSSWDYLYGTPLPFSFTCEAKFDWGQVQVQLDAKNGHIQTVKVYTDSMDWQLPGVLEKALTGCRFSGDDIQMALYQNIADPQIADDLCQLFKEQNL